MSKSTFFIGQPIYTQVLNFLNKTSIRKLAKESKHNHYTKKFDGYTHLVTLLFAVINRYDSIREIVVGLLSNANKLAHLGIQYCIKRSTFSDANHRRSCEFFGEVYQQVYNQYAHFLSDSRKLKSKMRKLYIMDSTTITLFSNILKGAGRNPLNGKKKGGIKVHTVTIHDENVPCLIRFTSAAKHDHLLLKEVILAKGSFIVFDKGYVDYTQYENFSNQGITYITKLKNNAVFEGVDEIEIPEKAHSGILKDEIIILKKGKMEHKCRRIAFWDDKKGKKIGKLICFLTNNLDIEADEVIEIYRRRWQIETLFKQLKQNFPLKYFYGDSVNAIKSQIWITLIANLLLTVIHAKIKRFWSFSNLATMVRQNLMFYIDLFRFLENPEKEWLNVNKKEVQTGQFLLFN